MNSPLLHHRGAIALFVAILALSAAVWAPSARTQETPASAAPSVPIVFAKFEKSFNTKKAKVGDEITAKTLRNLRLKDLAIPKGSRLAGTVAAVKSKKDGNGNSSLAIKFDRIEMKGNKEMRVQGLIVSIGENSGAPEGMGPTSVLSRGGVGSTNGTDPDMEVDKGVVKDDIPPGSSLPGVALGRSLNANGESVLLGIKTDIKFDSDTEIKVALFQGR
jgi:hypothetical protein